MKKSVAVSIALLGVIILTANNVESSVWYTAHAQENPDWDYEEAANAPVVPESPLNASITKKNPSKQELRLYALEEAKKAGIWVEKFDWILEHESHYNPNARGDQKIDERGNGKCTNKKSPLYGKPANARGLGQITECWYPEISDEKADDYHFAVAFVINEITTSRDNCKVKYSTCRDWYKK